MLDNDLRYQYFCRSMDKMAPDPWGNTTLQCRESLYNYLVYGFEPGGFLTAVLSNDLYRATYSADFENRKHISQYVVLIHNTLPAECYGSRAKVSKWIKMSIRRREKLLTDRNILPDLFEIIKMTAEEPSV